MISGDPLRREPLAELSDQLATRNRAASLGENTALGAISATVVGSVLMLLLSASWPFVLALVGIFLGGLALFLHTEDELRRAQEVFRSQRQLMNVAIARESMPSGASLEEFRYQAARYSTLVRRRRALQVAFALAAAVLIAASIALLAAA